MRSTGSIFYSWSSLLEGGLPVEETPVSCLVACVPLPARRDEEAEAFQAVRPTLEEFREMAAGSNGLRFSSRREASNTDFS